MQPGQDLSPLLEMRSPKPYMVELAGAEEVISKYCSLKMSRCPLVFQMGSGCSPGPSPA